jgi:hypothetical protein
MKRLACAVLALLWLGACGSSLQQQSPSAAAPAAQPQTAAVAAPAPAAVPTPASPTVRLRWKALAAGGDDSIVAFDNAVDRFTTLMTDSNVQDVRRFTSTISRVAPDRPIATVDALDAGLKTLRPGAGEACLIFLTSHGARDGLLMKQDLDQQQRLNPARFGRMMDEDCGQAPTVAIVSGCYSGIFLGQVTEASNRIILTAARRDRTSFGCSADQDFTYFDACLFDAWPLSGTWEVLFNRTADCVRQKERTLGFQYSQPQAWFGDNMRNVPLP